MLGGYSTQQTASTANQWTTGYYNYSGVTNWMSTVGNYTAFAGVQLEKGTVATPFEFRPFAMELQLCQRYFETIGNFGWMGYPNGIPSFVAVITFKVPKRSSPSVSLINALALAQLSIGLVTWPVSTTTITASFMNLTGCSFQLVQSNSGLYFASSTVPIVPTYGGTNYVNVFTISDEL